MQPLMPEVSRSLRGFCKQQHSILINSHFIQNLVKSYDWTHFFNTQPKVGAKTEKSVFIFHN